MFLKVKTGDVGNPNPTINFFENTSILPDDSVKSRSFKWRKITRVEGGLDIEYKGKDAHGLFIPDGNISAIEYANVEVDINPMQEKRSAQPVPNKEIKTQK